MTTDARIIDLEMRFMTLERFTHELSDVVASQQRAIDSLLAEVKQWRERQLDGSSHASAEGESPHEKPPHY